jgi:hypothetical protein
VFLNLVLATMIIMKLIAARRAARVFGAAQTASLYSSVMAIVVESALAWVLAILLGVIFGTNGFEDMPIGLLFSSISENMTVRSFHRWAARGSDETRQLLSPAMLLYWIAYNMHYTPSAAKTSVIASSSEDEIDAAEKQDTKREIIL